MRLSRAGKTPLSRAAPGLAFFLTSALIGVASLFLPMCDSDEKHDVPDEIGGMTLLKALGHNEFTTVGLFISIAAIFVVLGFSLTAFVTGEKLTSIQTAGYADVAAGVAFVVGRVVDFMKMKRDGFPLDQLGTGFILFTVVGIFMLITGFAAQNAVDRIETGSKASDLGAAAVHDQGSASETDQSEP